MWRHELKRAHNNTLNFLFFLGGLSKVNVATLYDWSKKNGVPCKAKDKKDELVNKILIKLNLFVPNEP